MAENAGYFLCWQCGYDLRMLNPTGKCPECGLPISGTSFYKVPQKWLRWMWWGSLLWFLSACGFSLWLMRMITRIEFSDDRGLYLLASTVFLFLIGSIFLLRKEPRRHISLFWKYLYGAAFIGVWVEAAGTTILIFCIKQLLEGIYASPTLFAAGILTMCAGLGLIVPIILLQMEELISRLLLKYQSRQGRGLAYGVFGVFAGIPLLLFLTELVSVAISNDQFIAPFMGFFGAVLIVGLILFYAWIISVWFQLIFAIKQYRRMTIRENQ